MSYTFTLSGRTSTLTTRIYPSIILDDDETYVIGLIDFMTFNTIPNIDESNNKFYIGPHTLKLPEGTYEITDIEKNLNILLTEADEKLWKEERKEEEKKAHSTQNNETIPILVVKKPRNEKSILHLRANHNTFKCEIKSNQPIDFEKPNTMKNILGFGKQQLEAYKTHISKFPISISKVNSICVECNLVQNSYNNEQKVHILHMFYPNVPPGYKILENPTNVIYLPINTRFIDEITLKITDQHGNLVNFKRELITVRLHLKRFL